MQYIAYLDEFGHIGPFVNKDHDTYNESPVFGLAGYIIPVEEVRGFSTWFFQRKCELLSFEIKRSGEHPATWEKKGSSLYTITNVEKYIELRKLTNRFLNKIRNCGGRVFYVGIEKSAPDDGLKANNLHKAVFRESIKRLNEFCGEDDWFLLALDEHDQSSNLITQATYSMFGGHEPAKRLIEPPFHLESHRFQTMQAAVSIAE